MCDQATVPFFIKVGQNVDRLNRLVCVHAHRGKSHDFRTSRPLTTSEFIEKCVSC